MSSCGKVRLPSRERTAYPNPLARRGDARKEGKCGRSRNVIDFTWDGSLSVRMRIFPADSSASPLSSRERRREDSNCQAFPSRKGSENAAVKEGNTGEAVMLLIARGMAFYLSQCGFRGRSWTAPTSNEDITGFPKGSGEREESVIM